MHPILIYDSDCKFCINVVNWLRRRMGTNSVTFISGQSAEGINYLQFHHLEDFQSVVLLDKNSVYTHSDAVFRVIQKLRTPWNWLSVFRLLPSRLTDAVYNFIARKRTCVKKENG